MCSLCEVYVQPMWNLCEVYVKPMWSLCEAYVQPIMWSLCEIYVQPMWSLSAAYVKSMCSLCAAYVKSMWNLCAAYVKPMCSLSAAYVQPMCNLWLCEAVLLLLHSVKSSVTFFSQGLHVYTIQLCTATVMDVKAALHVPHDVTHVPHVAVCAGLEIVTCGTVCGHEDCHMWWEVWRKHSSLKYL